jgi:predicted GTPase
MITRVLKSVKELFEPESLKISRSKLNEILQMEYNQSVCDKKGNEWKPEVIKWD